MNNKTSSNIRGADQKNVKGPFEIAAHVSIKINKDSPSRWMAAMALLLMRLRWCWWSSEERKTKDLNGMFQKNQNDLVLGIHIFLFLCGERSCTKSPVSLAGLLWMRASVWAGSVWMMGRRRRKHRHHMKIQKWKWSDLPESLDSLKKYNQVLLTTIWAVPFQYQDNSRTPPIQTATVRVVVNIFHIHPVFFPIITGLSSSPISTSPGVDTYTAMLCPEKYSLGWMLSLCLHVLPARCGNVSLFVLLLCLNELLPGTL